MPIHFAQSRSQNYAFDQSRIFVNNTLEELCVFGRNKRTHITKCSSVTSGRPSPGLWSWLRISLVQVFFVTLKVDSIRSRYMLDWFITSSGHTIYTFNFASKLCLHRIQKSKFGWANINHLHYLEWRIMIWSFKQPGSRRWIFAA